MICINCFHKNTSVINSRAHKKNYSVWRRRKCTQCQTIFTTLEKPSLTHGFPVAEGGTSKTFNLGRLVVSIAEAFTHAPVQGKEHALALAETVESTLTSQVREISKEDIEAVTHQVLKHFDELAALQYAAKHQLIVDASLKRRGRPSVVSRSR